MNLVRRAWAASSRPRSFHASLPDRPRVATAIAVAAASGVVASLALAVVLMRATASTAPLPFLVGAPLVVVPYLAIVSLLGGLVLMRPSGMDLRAWEVVLWGWAPAGFLGASLVPVGLVAPVPTLIGAALMLPPWHLWTVWSGTAVHATRRPRTAMVLYALATLVVPLLVAGLTLAALATAD